MYEENAESNRLQDPRFRSALSEWEEDRNRIELKNQESAREHELDLKRWREQRREFSERQSTQHAQIHTL